MQDQKEGNKKSVHPCEVAQEFMKRAEMKGGEVEIYAQTFNWLAKVIDGSLQVVPQESLVEAAKHREASEVEIKDLNTELDAAYARLGSKRPAKDKETLAASEEMLSEGGPSVVTEVVKDTQPERRPPS